MEEKESAVARAKLPITGCVITCDEADRIVRCVRSLALVCSEVVVVDSGSRDDTVALAKSAGARVLHQDWLGYAAQKNLAISQATQPWILLLDADEWLRASDLSRLYRLFGMGLVSALPAHSAAAVEQADVWCFTRRTHFLGGALRFGGRGSESVERLFRRDVRYLPADVHERLDLRNRTVKNIRIRIEHDTARSQEEYVRKLDRYAALWAGQRRRSGRRAGRMAGPLHAAAYWIKNYILRGGFLDGEAGYRYHLCQTHYVYRKYSRLHKEAP